jgi:hypothetical protein
MLHVSTRVKKILVLTICFGLIFSCTDIRQSKAALITNKTVSTPLNNLGLMGYWTFDGVDTPWTSSSAGTTIDKSGNGRTGTLTNMNRATAPVQGKVGQGLRFDGISGNYVNIGTLDIPGAITLCSWAKWDGLADSELISNKDVGGSLQYNLEIVNNGTGSEGAVQTFWTNAGLNNLATATGIITQYNRWYHICVVRTNNTTGVAYVLVVMLFQQMEEP